MLGNGFVLNMILQALPEMAVVALGLALSLLRVAAGRWARLAAAGFALLLAQDVLWLSANFWFYLGSSRFGGGYRLLGLVDWLGTFSSAAGLLLLVLAVFSARGAWGGDRPSTGNRWESGYGPHSGVGPQAGNGSRTGYGSQPRQAAQATAPAPHPGSPPQQPPAH